MTVSTIATPAGAEIEVGLSDPRPVMTNVAGRRALEPPEPGPGEGAVVAVADPAPGADGAGAPTVSVVPPATPEGRLAPA
jgi:hypothetical protein